jgi:hypothetical protein
MIVGLGALTVGGGAVFGSGAFSSTEAQRTVDVNVIDNTDLPSEFLDILYHAGNANYQSVGVKNNSETDPTAIYPAETADIDNYDDTNFSVSEEYVSLIANDVTLIFGTTDNELPPNATINYQDLFAVVNDNNSPTKNFEVTFEVTGANATFEFDGDATKAEKYTTTVDNDNNEEITLDLTTADTESGTLEITIDEI